jgi:hypothetical protein
MEVISGGDVQIDEKIDGNSKVGIAARAVRIGQKIDGGSQVRLRAGSITIGQQVGGGSRVTYLAEHVFWGTSGVNGGAVVTADSGSRFEVDMVAASSYFETPTNEPPSGPVFFSMLIAGFISSDGLLTVLPGDEFFAAAQDHGSDIYTINGDQFPEGAGWKDGAGHVTIPLTILMRGTLPNGTRIGAPFTAGHPNRLLYGLKQLDPGYT